MRTNIGLTLKLIPSRNFANKIKMNKRELRINQIKKLQLCDNHYSCRYCNGIICNGEKKTIAEWNQCPFHKADWETNTSIPIYLFSLFTFGIIRELIFRRKLKKYTIKFKNKNHIKVYEGDGELIDW